MAREGLGIEEVIDISTTVQAGGTIRSEFGTGLLMVTDDAIPAGGSRKITRFAQQSAVAALFGNGRVASDSAVWFGADPKPRALYIGRWAQAAVNTRLVSGPVTATQPTIKAITDGSYRLKSTDDTGITFAGVGDGDSFTEIAAHFQDQLRTITGLSTATVEWGASTSRFTIDFGTTDDVGAFETAESSVGTDLTVAFSLAASAGADYWPGRATEDLSAAVTDCVGLATAGAPVALMLGSDIPTTYTNSDGATVTSTTEMRNYAQAGDFMFALLDTSTGALTTGESTSALASANAAQQSHVIPVYSRGDTIGTETYPPRPDIAIMAKLSSQRFNQPQSIITLVPKPLPSTGFTTLSQNQRQELERKRACVYTTVGGSPSLLGGFTAKSGVWADAQWWLLWLKNEMEVTIFEGMRSSKRFDVAELTDAVNRVMNKAIISGGAKPGGRVSDPIKHDIRDATGNHEFDGILQNGYLLYVDPPGAQTDADRNARIGRFTIWVAPSDAIHSVSGAIILSG